MMAQKGIMATLVASALLLGFAGTSSAQDIAAEIAADQDASNDKGPADGAGLNKVDEIIVFARKRDETLQDAPVAITAFRAEDLQRYNVSSLEDAASLTPGLVINSGGGATGATITLRGVSTGNFSAAVDQAVSTNIDGIQISRGLIVRQGLFDMAQIEILKGPQALFFGKNSPGGIMAIRTADPTDEWFAQAEGGYGIRSDEYRFKAVLSGPVTEKLGIRAAFQYRDADGPFRNLAFEKRTASLLGGAITNDFEGAKHKHTEDATEYTGRLTATYDMTDSFSVRFKFSATDTRNSGRNSTAQLYSCPESSFYRQFDQGVIDCVLDERVWVPNTQRDVAAIQPQDNPADGAQYEETRAYLTSLELKYEFEEFSLTSVSGYYDRSSENYQDVSYNDFTANFGSLSKDTYQVFSEELRFQSEFDGPFNFMVGLYYQNEFTDIDNNGTIGLSALIGLGAVGIPLAPELAQIVAQLPSLPLGTLVLPAQLGGAAIPLQGAEIDSVTYSAFAQADYDVWRDIVNVSLGLRYTFEEKDYLKTSENRPATTPVPLQGVEGLGPVEGGLSGTRDFSNLSPEVTVKVQPNDDWTIYGSYKQGYKSGGYNTSLFGDPQSLNDVAFDEETVEGFEGGVKARLQGGALSVNLNLYNYLYSDLQTSFLEGITLRVLNAEEASVRGVEFDFAYVPDFVDGLSLRGAFNHNRGRYKDFVTACYQGQNEQTGCDLPIDVLPFALPVNPPGTGPNVQNLAGQQMFQAPDWSANAGLSYLMPVLRGRLVLGVNFDAVYTGSYQSHDKANPLARMDAVWRYNASVTLASEDDRFLLSLIGTNLTNELNATFTMESPLPGLVPGTPADLIAFTSPPRAILLRGTFTY